MKIKLHTFKLARAASTVLVLGSLAGIVGFSSLAAGASPSELLEKGIYSEETKGDLEAAMKLYQEVVAEAKGGQAVAAQAQYRLGVCFYKKKNYAEANAAFEKLVKDYPDQKELVSSANQYLSGAVELLAAPWVDGEEQRLDIKFPTGYKLGTAIYTVDAGQLNGQPIWKLHSHMFVGVQQLSRVEVQADSFKPIHSRWKHTLIGDADTVFEPGQAELKLAGKEVKKIELKGVVYDNEEVIQLMRRLPLEDKYKTTLHIFTGLGGGNILPVCIEVTGPEKVEVAAGTFDCYKVELSLKQTFWYSADAHHYLVKFEGGGVVGELSGISQRKAGAPVKYTDATYNFSLTAPADWIFYSPDNPEKPDEPGRQLVLMIDPEGKATGMVSVGKVKDLKPEAKASPRAWAELKLADGAKMLKGLKARPDSWKERTVAGQPAVSLLGDFEEGKEKKVGYAVFSIGKTNATMFVVFAGAQDFETLRPAFDAILDSYSGN